jgi:hypothetical protein
MIYTLDSILGCETRQAYSTRMYKIEHRDLVPTLTAVLGEMLSMARARIILQESRNGRCEYIQDVAL